MGVDSGAGSQGIVAVEQPKLTVIDRPRHERKPNTHYSASEYDQSHIFEERGSPEICKVKL